MDIKYAVKLDVKPVDAKGYNVVASKDPKKPFAINGVVNVNMDEYLKGKDLKALAIKSAVIDIQAEERNKVLTKLGITKASAKTLYREGMAESYKAMLSAKSIDQKTYDFLVAGLDKI
jgi:hypothetical protein